MPPIDRLIHTRYAIYDKPAGSPAPPGVLSIPGVSAFVPYGATILFPATSPQTNVTYLSVQMATTEPIENLDISFTTALRTAAENPNPDALFVTAIQIDGVFVPVGESSTIIHSSTISRARAACSMRQIFQVTPGVHVIDLFGVAFGADCVIEPGPGPGGGPPDLLGCSSSLTVVRLGPP